MAIVNLISGEREDALRFDRLSHYESLWGDWMNYLDNRHHIKERVGLSFHFRCMGNCLKLKA